MARNDELDGLIRDPLMTEEDWAFLREAMNPELQADIAKINEYVRHTCYGHSVANLFRDTYEPDYLEIVRATAKKLKINVRDHHTVNDIEDRILVEIIDQMKDGIIKEKGQAEWDRIEREAEEELRKAAAEGRMPGADAKAVKGAAPGTIMALIYAGRLSGIGIYLWANRIFFAISRFLGLGIGVAVAGPIIGRLLSLLLGPPGWMLTAVWLIWDLGKTNWRKTIQAVIAIAILRRQIDFRRSGGDGPTISPVT